MNLYPRRSLEAIALARKGTEGHVLEGLKFEGNKTIASNGRYMITTTYKANPETPNYLSYPVKNAWDEREENPIIIEAEKIKQAIKILPSKKDIKTLPILGHVAIGKTCGSEEICLKTADGAIHAKPMEGRFPNTDKVIPDYQNDNYIRVGLCPKLLKDISTLLAKDCHTLVLHISKKRSENKPIVITTEDEDFDNEIILMPRSLPENQG